jgi:hypothetical protein
MATGALQTIKRLHAANLSPGALRERRSLLKFIVTFMLDKKHKCLYNLFKRKSPAGRLQTSKRQCAAIGAFIRFISKKRNDALPQWQECILFYPWPRIFLVVQPRVRFALRAHAQAREKVRECFNADFFQAIRLFYGYALNGQSPHRRQRRSTENYSLNSSL